MSGLTLIRVRQNRPSLSVFRKNDAPTLFQCDEIDFPNKYPACLVCKGPTAPKYEMRSLSADSANRIQTRIIKWFQPSSVEWHYRTKVTQREENFILSAVMSNSSLIDYVWWILNNPQNTKRTHFDQPLLTNRLFIEMFHVYWSL